MVRGDDRPSEGKGVVVSRELHESAQGASIGVVLRIFHGFFSKRRGALYLSVLRRIEYSPECFGAPQMHAKDT
jgi:hypothetical protein